METIIIATDFSQASRSASFYGIKLAQLLGAKVVLLNVYSRNGSSVDNIIGAGDEEIKHISKQGLKDEINWLEPDKTVQIERRSIEGIPAKAILTEAKKANAKWIIAGMKGGGKMARKLLGGTAYSLSRHSFIPLILVPAEGWFTPPKTIALASDIDHNTDIRILDSLEEFGLKCKSKMLIVRVIKKGMDEVIERLMIPSRVKWHCKDLHTSFEFLKGNDVADAMNSFVKENDVDMIAMVSQEHTLFEMIFEKSDIKEMMALTNVPLIILPAKVNMQYNTETSQEAGKQ